MEVIDKSYKVYEIIKQHLGDGIGAYPQMLFYCPNCKHHKPKLSINFASEVFNCWVCASEAIQKPTRGRTFTQLFNKLHLPIPDFIEPTIVFGKSLSDLSTIDLIKAKVKSLQVFGGTPPNTIGKKQLNFDYMFKKEFVSVFNITNSAYKQYCLNYLHNDRKLSDEEIAKYNIGILNNKKYLGRIIIPSYDLNGHINYFLARSLYFPLINPKYINPDEHDILMEEFIFNELQIDFTKPVYLVEGFFDSKALPNAIPLLGTNLKSDSYLIRNIIYYNTEVIISLDPDAEIKQNNMVRDIFKPLGIKYSFIYNDMHKDYGSMSSMEVSKTISDIKHTNFDVLRRKLKNFSKS